MSSLLDDIIKLATDGKQPLPDILRKCLILGHELKNETLKTWANQELNGYPSAENLPEYRIAQAEARGNFTGPFQSGARNWPIPSLALEKIHRDFGEHVYLTQAVSAFQDVVSGRRVISSSRGRGIWCFFTRSISSKAGMYW